MTTKVTRMDGKDIHNTLFSDRPQEFSGKHCFYGHMTHTNGKAYEYCITPPLPEKDIEWLVEKTIEALMEKRTSTQFHTDDYQAEIVDRQKNYWLRVTRENDESIMAVGRHFTATISDNNTKKTYHFLLQENNYHLN